MPTLDHAGQMQRLAVHEMSVTGHAQSVRYYFYARKHKRYLTGVFTYAKKAHGKENSVAGLDRWRWDAMA